MSDEITFTRDLAVILISAEVFTIISKALKQPSVLGYIIAGFLIGPSVGFYFGISSTEAVKQWSDIGIIFLMFGLGLEFSFKKLMRVGGSAFITTACKFLGVFMIGFITGNALSWSTMESIFLGGLLAMSSTTVIINIFPNISETTASYLNLAVTLIGIAPFVYGIGVSNCSGAHIVKLLKENEKNTIPILALILARVLIATCAILGIILSRIDLSTWSAISIVIIGVIHLLAGRYFFKKYSSMEKRFIENLNQKENANLRLSPVTTSINKHLKGHDVHIETLILPQNSEFTGHRLRSIPIRQESGASIIKIMRGERNIIIPSSDVRVYPFDKLLAVGTTEQLDKLKNIIKSSVPTDLETNPGDDFTVASLTLHEDSYFTGKALRDCSLSDFQCMMISVMRNGEFMANPKADFKFQSGDVVWIAGTTSTCEWLK